MLKGANIFCGDSISKIVVFLHGYGASGDNLIPLGQQWSETLKDVLYVSPNAPHLCNQDFLSHDIGYMWFEIGSPYEIKKDLIQSGLLSVRSVVTSYITQLLDKYQLTWKDCCIVGFSQGAMIATDLLTVIDELKCIIGYSGAYYPLEVSKKSFDKKALLIHGTDDEIIDYSYALQAEKALKALDIDVMLETCTDLGHSINEKGVIAGLNFLQKNL